MALYFASPRFPAAVLLAVFCLIPGLAVVAGAGPSGSGDPVDCVRPFAVPDRWDDADGDGYYTLGEPYSDTNGNGHYDFGEPFTDYDTNGVREPDEFYDPDVTGYTFPQDTGAQIVLHAPGSPGLVPGQYYVVDLPPLGQETEPATGIDAFRAAMASCSPYPVAAGDSQLLEPGVIITPMVEELQAIIGADPGASWNEATGEVVGSSFAVSPRLLRFSFLDPRSGPYSGRSYIVVSKIGALFVESVASNGAVTGRFVPLETGTPVRITTWGRLRWRFGTRAR